MFIIICYLQGVTNHTITLRAPSIVTRTAGMNPNAIKFADSPTPTENRYKYSYVHEILKQ